MSEKIHCEYEFCNDDCTNCAKGKPYLNCIKEFEIDAYQKGYDQAIDDFVYKLKLISSTLHHGATQWSHEYTDEQLDEMVITLRLHKKSLTVHDYKRERGEYCNS